MIEPEPVGVRQLRQNLSVYLRRVRTGASFVVTERGMPVARLVPAGSGDETWDRLVADGKIIPATTDWRRLPPPPEAGPEDRPLSLILRELRDAERF